MFALYMFFPDLIKLLFLITQCFKTMIFDTGIILNLVNRDPMKSIKRCAIYA